MIRARVGFLSVRRNSNERTSAQAKFIRRSNGRAYAHPVLCGAVNDPTHHACNCRILRWRRGFRDPPIATPEDGSGWRSCRAGSSALSRGWGRPWILSGERSTELDAWRRPNGFL